MTYPAPSNGPVFCVEGGGTHTRGVLHMHGSESPSASGKSGSCNPSTGFEAAVSSVRSVWEQVSEGNDLAPGDVLLVMGVAGIANKGVRSSFVDALGGFGEVVALSDGYAAMIGCGGGAACGMVVAGTGCAGHRLRPDGTSFQRDGWGWIGGDRGSGAWIGLEAIKHALCVRDGLAPSDPLAEAVLDELGGSTHDIVGWLTRCKPNEIAMVSRHVFDQAGRGLAIADKLLDQAAGHLRDLFGSLGCDSGEPLFLSGSIAEALIDRIGVGMETKPVARAGRALHGCWLVAMGRAPLEWPPEA